MPGVRLLLPLTYGLSVRYAVPTGLVDELASRTDLVVALGWDDDELRKELTVRGVEVVELPPVELTHSYRSFRRRLSALRDRRLDSATTPIRIQRQRAALPSTQKRLIDQARRWRERAIVATARGAASAEAAEPAEVEAGTNVATFRSFLDDHRIDAVLALTPYHDQDALLLWAARTTGRPTVTSVISFDNPTTRERLLVRSERLLVWNRYNRDELLRSYPELDPSSVRVVGAPQFDLHRRPELVMPRSEWSAELGIDADRPVILFGAGPSEIVPHEHRLAELIDDAISDGRIPGRPHLLVRRHPADPPGTWSSAAVQLRNGTVADPWVEGPGSFRSWPSDADITMQMSTLAHAEAHVNVCSSMSLDGAVFDRPQVGPVFVPGLGRSDAQRIRSFYRQEHWQPIRRSGAVPEVADGASLIRELSESLAAPQRRHDQRQRMVEDVLTYTDGASTARLVDEVMDHLDRGES